MLQLERHNQIISKLNLLGQVSVKELAKEFNVTDDCIRKDLKILEKQNKLKRIHGGATQLRENPHAFHVSERKDLRHPEKQAIALKAIELIKPGSTIFLGVSTVNLEIAKLIYQRNLNIILVTNMIDIMQLFTGNTSTKLVFLAGHFNRAKDGFIGALTMNQIKQFKFDMSFIGLVGMDIHEGNVTTYDIEDGLTKAEVIHSSKQSYIVAESAKFNLDGNHIFANLDDFTGYIPEKPLDKEIHNKLLDLGLEVI